MRCRMNRSIKRVNLPVFVLFFIILCCLMLPYRNGESSPFIGSTTTTVLYAIEDSYVDASNPDANYGNADLLAGASSTNLSQQIIYVKFDLSSIPQNAFIVSANLSLWFSRFSNLYFNWFGLGDSIGSHYCSNNSWTENAITWNNCPNYVLSHTDLVDVGRAGADDCLWDVTSSVVESLPLAELTEVLVFDLKYDGYGYAEFVSSESSQKPKLEIEYTLEPVSTVSLELVLDTGVNPCLTPCDLALIDLADSTFTLSSVTNASGWPVPKVINVANGGYAIECSSSYRFVRWETTGGVTVSNQSAQSTTITISGNGTLKIIGNAKTIEYNYDQRLNTNNISLPAGEISANVFYPQFSGQLVSVRYYVSNLSSTGPNTFKVHVMNSSFNDLITPFNVTPTSAGWFDVDLAPCNLSIVKAQSFFLGMEFLSSHPSIGLSSTFDNAWQWNGTNWNRATKNFMIRAVVCDNTPPVSTNNYDGLWHKSDFAIYLTATDSNGILETCYKLNGGPIQKGFFTQISSEGENNGLEYWSVDGVGNEEIPHKMLTQIKLDKTKPVANAGQNQIVTAGSNVAFDASGSTDNIGIVDYSWNFGDGTTGTGKTATHTYLNSGTYTAQVTIQDAAGNTATATVVTTVQPSPTPSHTPTTTMAPTTTNSPSPTPNIPEMAPACIFVVLAVLTVSTLLQKKVPKQILNES